MARCSIVELLNDALSQQFKPSFSSFYTIKTDKRRRDFRVKKNIPTTALSSKIDETCNRDEEKRQDSE